MLWRSVLLNFGLLVIGGVGAGTADDAVRHAAQRNLKGKKGNGGGNPGKVKVLELHADWIYCSDTFWSSGTSCRTSTRFQPNGYFFETGRDVRALGLSCDELVAQDLVPVVECDVPQGDVLVVPAVTLGCTSNQAVDDFTFTKELCWDAVGNPDKYGITWEVSGSLDGKSLNSPYVWTKVDEPYWGGCTGYKEGLSANGGFYAFIKTSNMEVGSTHELVLLGDQDGDGCDSAVKHIFTIV